METSDIVARLGGDEFAILARRPSPDRLEELGERVAEALAEPHQVHGHLLSIPGSVGVAAAAPHEASAVVMRRAAEAMYTVKRARRPRSR